MARAAVGLAIVSIGQDGVGQSFSAVVLTSGTAIVVERHNGTLFAVTVPQPDLLAALLTTLAAR